MSAGTIYDTAYKGDFNQVKVKVDEIGLSLLTLPDPNGRLLLHWAALGGNDYLVEWLIENGSPIDCQDDTLSTPLILGASAGRSTIVRLLIGKGANVNHKTNRGQSALHYSCSKGHLEVVKLLLEHDADVNITDILSASPLHRAAAQGRTNVVKILLNHRGVRVDIQDSTGSTPLHLACEEDREHVAALLVKAGADTNKQNKDKKTPLDLSSPQLAKILKLPSP